MHVYWRGIRVELTVTGTSEVINEDGSRSLFLDIEASIPPGPGGPGEPVDLPSAA